MDMSRRFFLGVSLSGFVRALTPSFAQVQRRSLPLAPAQANPKEHRIRSMLIALEKELQEEEDEAQRRAIVKRIQKGRYHLRMKNYSAAIHVLGWSGSC